MSSASKIEWTEQTWNPLVGCSIVSPGCTNCYAMKMAVRLEAMGRQEYRGKTKVVNGNGVWTGEVGLVESRLIEPLLRKKPTMYFVNSMSDLFHEFVPDEWIDRIFAVMALTPQHTYQVLTKRAERMRRYMDALTAHCADSEDGLSETLRHIGELAGVDWRSGSDRWPLPNVWLGVSTERQEEADERIPHLLQTPAAVRFISAEPLLGPIKLGFESHGPIGWTNRDFIAHLDWVIVGGESGPGARPMHPQWARDLRDQCKAAGVPFFFKQHGAWAPICGMTEDQIDACYHPAPEGSEARRREKTESLVLQVDGTRFEGDARFSYGAFQLGTHPMTMFNLGKKAAGRLLDNRTHDDMPGRVG